MARVEWESEILRVQRFPRYWIDQASGPSTTSCCDPAWTPRADRRGRAAAARGPRTLAHAAAALARPAREFAVLALAELDGLDGRVDACAEALARIDPARRARATLRRLPTAAGALRQFGSELAAVLPTLPTARPIGRQRYEWFLREVACVPLTVDEIAGLGRREYDRAVWLELLHATRNRDLPVPPLPAGADEQARQQRRRRAGCTAVLRRPRLAVAAAVAATVSDRADAGRTWRHCASSA